MKANGNFGSVTASNGGGFKRLQPGAHVCRIHHVSEDEGGSLEVYYDVLDQDTEKMMFTSDLEDPETAWRHSFRVFAGDNFWGRYKAITDAIEGTEENHGFVYQDVDGGEQQLVGKWLGIVFRDRTYTAKRGKHKGEAVTALDANAFVTAAQAFAGDFDLAWAEPYDSRKPEEKAAQAAAAAAAAAAPAQPDAYQAATIEDEEIPFS